MLLKHSSTFFSGFLLVIFFFFHFVVSLVPSLSLSAFFFFSLTKSEQFQNLALTFLLSLHFLPEETVNYNDAV